MKHQFIVEPIKFSTIHELPNSWSNKDYMTLLEQMDFDGISDIPESELKEMCLMSLTDNEPEDAAKIVLEYIFKDRLNSGQIDNLSNEMLDECMWEEYADLSMHEEFFNATQLLYEAYNGTFPHPEVVRFQVMVNAKNATDLTLFKEVTESTLIRLLVKGMPDNTLINRLFDEQLEGDDFPEAKDIIWQLNKESQDGNSIVFDIISSEYWFKDFKYVKPFEVEIQSKE